MIVEYLALVKNYQLSWSNGAPARMDKDMEQDFLNCFNQRKRENLCVDLKLTSTLYYKLKHSRID